MTDNRSKNVVLGRDSSTNPSHIEVTLEVVHIKNFNHWTRFRAEVASHDQPGWAISGDLSDCSVDGDRPSMELVF